MSSTPNDINALTQSTTQAVDDINALTQSTTQAVDDLKPATYTHGFKSQCVCKRVTSSYHERPVINTPPKEVEVHCECGKVYTDYM